MRVFVSHSSLDKPAVLVLAEALTARGFEPLLDSWDVAAGHDIAAWINQGLESADAGIVVLSANAVASSWVAAEISALIFARVEKGKVLIPVVLDENVQIPALLAPLLRRRIDEIDAIADGLRNRSARPASIHAPELGAATRVMIELSRGTDGATCSAVRFPHGALSGSASTSHDMASALAAFRRGFGGNIRRDRASADLRASEAQMAELGRAVAAMCLPDGAAQALQQAIDECRSGFVEVCFTAGDEGLLGLPFETLRLPDGRLLATLVPVVVWRRPLNVAESAPTILAGPLKILVAVGAPDVTALASPALDQERELQNILDAVESLNQQDDAQVRILEVGHPDEIAAAFARDAYHVLHLSCHGRPGELELEDEDGRAVSVTPADLLAPLKRTGRPLPMVLLNTCHGGVSDVHDERPGASFAKALLDEGVPAVLAMQTAVSDGYATDLARAFYTRLLEGEHLRPSRALASARKDIEAARQSALRGGSHAPPEYATATLFIAGEEIPVADFGAERQPLHVTPVNHLSGPVPQLGMDDLIGRRSELREVLKAIRDPDADHVGAVVTGIGGVGKSALVGRAMQRLVEDGWVVAVHTGRYGLNEVFACVGAALRDAKPQAAVLLGNRFIAQAIGEPEQQRLIHKAIAEQRVLLLLDDFEQNLEHGGKEFLDPSTEMALVALAEQALGGKGRLLFTCRYPIPRAEGWLRRVTLGALSPAEMRKMVLRMPALSGLKPAEMEPVLRVINGHPRMLEFLDALLRGGKGKLPPHVSRKFRLLLDEASVDPAGAAGNLDESLRAAQLLIARNVFLDELLKLAQAAGVDEAMLQLAVSNLPVTAAGLARMLADDVTQSGDVEAAQRALITLEDLSLLHRLPDGSAIVHRWTAQGLAELDAAAHRKRFGRAARYRWWRVANETHELGDGVEATRNFLAGHYFDEAVDAATACLDAMQRFQQSMAIASFASEVLETLPESNEGFAMVADEESRAFVALGETGRAIDRYSALLVRQQRVVDAEPDNANHRRNLSVSFNKMGELHRAMGQGEQARQAFASALAIRQGLAEAEPDHAGYQRDLSVSFSKMGDLHRALGQGEQARQAFSASLEIAQRLAEADPDQADYQRDLSVAFDKMGSLHRALGQGEQARQAFSASLEIARRLADAEPDRADYQRGLSISFSKMGHLYRALGQGEQARQAFSAALEIAQRLAEAEPDRVDYQRDLSVSFDNMGDLYRARGQSEHARQAFSSALEISRRLAAAEPDRADYQRDLSVSFSKMGDIHRALGQGEQARQAFSASLEIAQHLVEAEPDRADYQRDLSVSFERVGDLCLALGEVEEARQALSSALDIRQRLCEAEPDRTDYQRDLSVSLGKAGALFLSLGQAEEARQAFSESSEIVRRLAEAEPDRADYQRDLSVSYHRMAALFMENGDLPAAIEMYAEDLAIAERLALAEPLRADYQEDLIISLLQMGTYAENGSDASRYLLRAQGLVDELVSSGRASSANRAVFEQVRKLMEERGIQPG